MKLLFVFLALSSVLLLSAGSTDGRKELGVYWKKVMKGQPMPEVIQDLVDAGSKNFKDNNINADNFVSDVWSVLNVGRSHGATAPKEEKPVTFENRASSMYYVGRPGASYQAYQEQKSLTADNQASSMYYVGRPGASYHAYQEEKPFSNADSRHCDDSQPSQGKFAKDINPIDNGTN